MKKKNEFERLVKTVSPNESDLQINQEIGLIECKNAREYFSVLRSFHSIHEIKSPFVTKPSGFLVQEIDSRFCVIPYEEESDGESKIITTGEVRARFVSPQSMEDFIDNEREKAQNPIGKTFTVPFYATDSNWTGANFGVLSYLKSSPDIIAADYYETTSSTGAWSGYIIYEDVKSIKLIPFQQELANAFDNEGVTVYISDRAFNEDLDISEKKNFEILIENFLNDLSNSENEFFQHLESELNTDNSPVELTELENGNLLISVVNPGELVDILEKADEGGYNEQAILYDLLESAGYFGNDWHTAFEIGLTDAPAIGYGAIYEDPDGVHSEEPCNYEKIWYFPSYEVDSFLDILQAEGSVIFKKIQ
jgi:hypothetical protein